MANNNQIYKMSNAGGFKSLTRYYDMLAGNTTWSPWSPVGAYDALAAVTVPSGGAASVSFSGIPTNYKHLQVRLTAATNKSVAYADLTMNVNNDTSANYSFHTFIGDPRPYIATDSAASTTSIYLGAVLTGTTFSGLNASYTGGSIIDILDYASTTKNKTVRALSGSDRNGLGNAGVSGNIGIASGAWYNSSTAINSITLQSPSNNFTEYSTFSLYGVK